MSKILIAPSILSADFAQMGKAVDDLKAWGADWVHCDVMDGVFVPNLTFGMPMVKALRARTDMTLDVHLMITSPERYIDRFIDAGADVVTFHAQACADPQAALSSIRSRGKKAGLVLNPDVDVQTVIPYLDLCDVVMLMGVFPGFGGQKFIPTVLDKISELKAAVGERKILIEIDGGVTEQNVAQMVERGVDVVVAGSGVFCSPDPAAAVRAIQGV